ncbi:restriction endonuclease subunit S, partial [Yersinia aldovae]|uniref:restriction endonuclease subunit S n=1 Tax=Yersinia aldovae TaxID=29483 RepID=UPI0011A6A17A
MNSKWTIKKISEIANFLNNKRVPLKSLDRAKRQGPYPYYGASGIVDSIDDYIFDGTYLLISEDGENLRTRKTPIAFKAHGKFWVNNHAHILSEKEDGALDYLEYYFSMLDLNAYITGAAQPKLNKSNLDSIDILYPCKDVRLFINSMLNSLTKKIVLNKKINQTLEQIAQALFKSWFVDFEPVKAKIAVLEAGGSQEETTLAAMTAISGKDTDSLAVFAHERPEQYAELKATAELFPSAMQDSELGEIPVGWEVGPLSDIATFTKGKIEVSKLTSDTYISTENMLENKSGISQASSLPSVSTVPNFSTGHILISNIRPYFKKIWLARFSGGRSADVLAFESKKNITIEFLYNLLYQDTFFDFMMLTSKGVKMPRGDKTAIMGWTCIKPQEKILNAFSKSINRLYLYIE